MEAVSIFITCILALGVVNRLMLIPPLLQTVVDGVLIGEYQCAFRNVHFNHGLDGLLLHIGQHSQHDLTATLHHAKDRWFVAGGCATSAFAFQASTPSFTVALFDHLRLSFVTSNDVDFIEFNFFTQDNRLCLTTIPSRNWVVMACTSSLLRFNAY